MAKVADREGAKSPVLTTTGKGRGNPVSNPQVAAAIDDSLHFTLVLETDSMALGKVRIEAKKYIGSETPVEIKMVIVTNNPLYTYLYPFVGSPADSIFIDNNPSYTPYPVISFFVQGDTALFGWDAYLNNIGFVNRDVFVADLSAIIPSSVGIVNETEVNNIILEVTKPESMPLYFPLSIKSGSSETYIVNGEEVRQKHNASMGTFLGSPIAGGAFDADSVIYANGHVLYLLSYKINATKAKSLTAGLYDVIMKQGGMENYPEYLTRAKSVIFLPGLPEINMSNPRMGGFYCFGFSDEAEIWVSQIISNPTYDPHSPYNVASNVNSISGLAVNVFHSVYGPIFTSDITNGMVRFFQLFGLKKVGIIDDMSVESEMVHHVNYYNNEIVAQGNDFPLDALSGSLEIPDYKFTKWFLFFDVLDRMVKENTSNTKEFMDVWNGFARKLRAAGGPNQAKKTQRYKMLEDALKDATGLDFTEFFDACVFGTTSLPHLAANGSTVEPLPIAVNYNTVYLKPTKWSKGYIPPPSPDIDTDGKLDTGDAIKLLQIIRDAPGTTVIDQNNDGKLSIADAVKLLLKIRDKNKKKNN